MGQTDKNQNRACDGQRAVWRRERDSNPRCPEGHNRFRVCPVRPLRHLSAVRTNREFYQARAILSFPFMYSRRAPGTVTDPSAFWQFSRIATRVRPTARPEPFSVCTGSGLPFSLRNLACMRRAWNASKLEHEEISRYVLCDGSQTSMS